MKISGMRFYFHEQICLNEHFEVELNYLLYRRELSCFVDLDDGDTDRSLYRFGDSDELLDRDDRRFVRYFDAGDNESLLVFLL